MPKPKIWSEFKEFLKEYRIMTLALAFIMGQAVNDLIKSFVEHIFMPLINPLIPGGAWQTATVSFGKIALGWGPFLSAFIHFAILAFMIFIVVKKLLTKRSA